MKRATQVSGEDLELAMRSILRLFADGNLVYRRREQLVSIDIARPASRLRRIREARAGGAA